MHARLFAVACLVVCSQSLCLGACHLIFPFSTPAAADADALLDGAADAATGEGHACAVKYGEVPGFILCYETATECAFNAVTEFTSCTAVCAAAGGTCLDVIDNPNEVGEECEIAPEPLPVSCDSSTFETMICICDR
jgi:hypothetical protein